MDGAAAHPLVALQLPLPACAPSGTSETSWLPDALVPAWTESPLSLDPGWSLRERECYMRAATVGLPDDARVRSVAEHEATEDDEPDWACRERASWEKLSLGQAS